MLERTIIPYFWQSIVKSDISISKIYLILFLKQFKIDRVSLSLILVLKSIQKHF